jgi:16S rRNA C967 or C1407 C5-methylase (RsmB/RsmF family)
VIWGVAGDLGAAAARVLPPPFSKFRVGLLGINRGSAHSVLKGTPKQLNPPKLQLKPNHSPQPHLYRPPPSQLPWLSSIHEFVKRATEAGAISRQEAVSMVPPLFMDVQPHHRASGGEGGPPAVFLLWFGRREAIGRV